MAAIAAERLDLMRGVAAYKWSNQLPVEDVGREARVLDAAADTGLRYSLTPESVARLFRIQIEAAKEIQTYWTQRWRAGERAPAAPDLAHELRPRILALGDALLEAAARGRPPGTLPEIEGLSAVTAAALEAAIEGLERYPTRLDQILATGVLRVGTTGDYAPFSLRRDSESTFEGIDVDLSEDLASSLGTRLELVQTSWPALLDDLAAGRFDIAMSGVSRTLARQRVGYFSAPYYTGGKSAICRCAERERFRSLEAIDQPGVRVVVNPGGTNELFVDQHLQRADKLVHEDNRSIFDEILAGRADVMITDAIEVELKSRELAGLCRAVPGLLNRQDKGFLMQRDAALLEYVDLWLDLRRGDGTLEETFARHGVSWQPAPARTRADQNRVR